MVAGTGHVTCRKDRGHTLADIATDRPRNAESVRCTPGLLADVAVRKLWLVRTDKRDNGDIYDPMRISCSGRNWNDPGVGERFRDIGPYLTTAAARSRSCLGIPTGSESSRGSVAEAPIAAVSQSVMSVNVDFAPLRA